MQHGIRPNGEHSEHDDYIEIGTISVDISYTDESQFSSHFTNQQLYPTQKAVAKKQKGKHVIHFTRALFISQRFKTQVAPGTRYILQGTDFALYSGVTETSGPRLAVEM